MKKSVSVKYKTGGKVIEATKPKQAITKSCTVKGQSKNDG